MNSCNIRYIVLFSNYKYQKLLVWESYFDIYMAKFVFVTFLLRSVYALL